MKLVPTTKASFRAFPPRERWVPDVIAYTRRRTAEDGWALLIPTSLEVGSVMLLPTREGARPKTVGRCSYPPR